MLKFFRRIRRKLLDEGNLKRYLVYAIGEILLVVLGILIALQINTWNQHRLQKKQEIDILQNLRNELGDNLQLFDASYDRHLEKWNAIQQLLHAGNSDLDIQALDSMFAKMVESGTFDPSEGVYNSMINSGKIELISNDDLRNKIAKLQDVMEDYREEEISTRKLNLESFLPYYIHSMAYNPMSLSDERTDQEKVRDREIFIDIIATNVFQAYASTITKLMSSIFREGPIYRDELTSILDMLESEISLLED